MLATPVGNAVPETGDTSLDVLIQGGRWELGGARELTYSFSIETEIGAQWSAPLKEAVRAALRAWSDVADLRFREIAFAGDVDASPADLALAPTGTFLGLAIGAVALGVFPDPAATDVLLEAVGSTRAESPNAEGDIYLDNGSPVLASLAPGSVGFAVLLHEIGHALGLKHPGDDGLNGRPLGSLGSSLTVMDAAIGNGAATPLLEDVRAIQHLYGANLSHRTGDDHYALASGARRALWDAGGIDTLDFSGMALAPGELSLEAGPAPSPLVFLGIAYGVTIENIVGTRFAERITGNAAGNRLDGGGGSDTLAGGDGDDVYVIDSAGDVVEEAGGGTDRVVSRVALDLGALAWDLIEQVLLAGSASLAATGNALDNLLLGNGAGNVLDGGALGADTLAGGAGNDVYRVRDATDVVVEAAGGGTDRIDAFFWAVAAIPEHVEDLVLLHGDAAEVTGNSLANRITGNDAANRLDGGAGADTLTGLGGDDEYFVDSPGDRLAEADGGGFDRVTSRVDHALGPFFEALSLEGAAGRATGNGLDNVLRGNALGNVLDGAAGNDTMAGGAGDDAYFVDSAGDVVIELGNEGRDTLHTPVGATLAGGLAHVENVTLLGSADVDVLGNGAANRLVGNAGANVLDGAQGIDTLEGGAGDDRYVVDRREELQFIADRAGVDTLVASVSVDAPPPGIEHIDLAGRARFAVGDALDNRIAGNARDNILLGSAGDDTLDGGAGADILLGGSGDDVYEVDSEQDVVVEAFADGLDTIRAWISFDLRATGLTVENLVLHGEAALGTGNDVDNMLAGNGVSNTLLGGAGADRFVFRHAPGAANIDRLPDFTPGVDRIVLDAALFAGATAPGGMAYDAQTGALYYDADGSGGSEAVQLAWLGSASSHPAFSASDVSLA